ncbi:PIN domain nuclease, a component of toxin-antitoxin system (PIN domain) [Pseudomonas asturiensis]|uniref:PIN domain nuclease, a component of toxin-antitoxin system (PIN domain) n=1 Tax=Pseudomonas asturiensis TaxID=1190415 RepID=A0A1M7PEF4_9PSED|nr:type II toxin-antitoxin system VapC family toxin [Pseudomonas asturiensis]SHN15250.1 PIN domain nuclease, a component of toxin-antitoxin system (PIN domain) [Pseudomonas asturiensis]
MKLLLDTHVLVWAVTGDRKLSETAAQLIDDEANTLYFSAASIWELTIKGAERTGVNPALLRKELIDAGYLELPITSVHGLTVDRLPNHHRDPFDRIMVAQALAEGVSLVTHDGAMHDYPHTIIV